MMRTSKKKAFGPAAILLIAGMIGISSFYFSRAEQPPPQPMQVIYEPMISTERLG